MKKIYKWLIIIFLLALMLILYARYVGTLGFITKEYTIMDDSIPTSFDGLKIVHFSDIHYNRAITLGKIDKIVEEINLINPDIVVFTGDIVDMDATINDKYLDKLANTIKKINSKYGKYAILGNHDYKFNKEKIVKLYNDAGFIYLENDYDIIYNNKNENIFIAGIGTDLHKVADIDTALERIKEKDDIDYKIILIHEPDIVSDIVKDYSVNLVLAGHSHGGQIRLPFLGALYTPVESKKYYDEYYNVNGTNLYISSGIGVSTVNYRLFNKPSINFYRINKEALNNQVNPS